MCILQNSNKYFSEYNTCLTLCLGFCLDRGGETSSDQLTEPPSRLPSKCSNDMLMRKLSRTIGQFKDLLYLLLNCPPNDPFFIIIDFLQQFGSVNFIKAVSVLKGFSGVCKYPNTNKDLLTL